MKSNQQSGFTLIDAVIAAGFLVAILGGVTMKVNSIKDHIKKTEAVLSADSLEVQMRPLLVDLASITHSAKKSQRKELSECLEGRKVCRSGRVYPLAIYLQGQTRPLTGSSAWYDAKGQRCYKSSCAYFQIDTKIQTNCWRAASCRKPDYVSVYYEVLRRSDKKKVRSGFLESTRFANKNFAGLTVSCPGDQILRGIGISGEPLCVRRSEVKLINEDGSQESGAIIIKAKDCRMENSGDKDQFYIQGIDPTGEITCGERFWQ